MLQWSGLLGMLKIAGKGRMARKVRIAGKVRMARKVREECWEGQDG